MFGFRFDNGIPKSGTAGTQWKREAWTMIGQTIFHYKILEKLGEGGMGIVYKAHDIKLDRFVALKFLPQHLAASQQDKSRFAQEAKAAAALNHPNVCSIIDIQEYDGPSSAGAPAGKQMFIVMEFVDGVTLREKKQSISFKQAIDIGVQIADGLAAAHEKGIVHRDIKPENIMIRKDGIAQIMDFGLAKLRGNITRLTKEGSTIGTAGYMSPEQVQGQDTDHRSDIFSFGILLYELFTGELPFKGIHETALMYEIVNVEPAPMSSVKPEIDPSLDAIVLECLEKDPNERTQSVKQVSVDLKHFKRETSRERLTRTIKTKPLQKDTGIGNTDRSESVQTPRRNWIWHGIYGSLLLVLLIYVWKPWNKDPAALPPPMHFNVDVPPRAPLIGGSDDITISPDGKKIVYAGSNPSNPQLFLRKIDQLDVQGIPNTEGADEPVFSPDGQWIAYVQSDKIKKVSILGGAPEMLCGTQGLPRGLWWAEDNNIYFGHISRALFKVPSAGGTPTRITTLDSANGEISHRYPQLLPDGKTILFTIKPNNISSFSDAMIAVQRLGTNEKKILIHGGTYGRFLPSGYLVYVRENTIFAARFDPDRLEIQGSPQPITQGGWLNEGSGSAGISVSTAGNLIYVPEGLIDLKNTALVWMDRQGKSYPLLDSLGSYGGVTVSPDNQKIALNLQAANDDIWIYQIARGTLTRLTFGGGNNNFPIWTPDNKYVVYNAEKGKSPNIYRKPWDGSGEEERLTTSDEAQFPSSISPDGKLLAFIQNSDIWILPLEGDRKPWRFIQSQATEATPMFSPDGRWMAYASNESGKFEVYVVPFPKHEGKWQISNGGGNGPIWSRNGKELLYGSGTSMMAAEITPGQSFDFSVPKKILELTSSNAVAYDVTSDGNRFIVGLARRGIFTINHFNIILNWTTELKEKFAENKN
ncbi:MAG: protein kinase [Bacteroidota bacterium]